MPAKKTAAMAPWSVNVRHMNATYATPSSRCDEALSGVSSNCMNNSVLAAKTHASHTTTMTPHRAARVGRNQSLKPRGPGVSGFAGSCMAWSARSIMRADTRLVSRLFVIGIPRTRPPARNVGTPGNLGLLRGVEPASLA
jgi:hypothetical protein